VSHADAAELVARCFSARTAAHFAHLKTKKYATHVALSEFYTDVVGATDIFAEAYQGVFGVIPSYPACDLHTGELTPIKELREWLAENRAKAARGQRELENLIDEITAVCDRAIYKIVNLG
jgi:phenylpyruvate tautomerase PptA (4-oxalocrotonate tautomerase family)